jgi:hypothetical protein
MAAVAGILFTDLLGKPKWFEAGSEEYWMPTAPLLAIEFLVLGFLELKRFQGWKETGTSGFLNAFPFDPAGEHPVAAGRATRSRKTDVEDRGLCVRVQGGGGGGGLAWAAAGPWVAPRQQVKGLRLLRSSGAHRGALPGV